MNIYEDKYDIRSSLGFFPGSSEEFHRVDIRGNKKNKGKNKRDKSDSEIRDGGPTLPEVSFPWEYGKCIARKKRIT